MRGALCAGAIGFFAFLSLSFYPIHYLSAEGPMAQSPEGPADRQPTLEPTPQIEISCDPGCDGECHSGKKDDDCGVCGGDNSTCADCLGTPNGTARDYGCGCGNPPAGECGCELGVKKDRCGVCGGDDSTCTDCMGVVGGSARDLGCGCGKPAPGPGGCADPAPAPEQCPALEDVDVACQDYNGSMKRTCLPNPFVSKNHKGNSVLLEFDKYLPLLPPEFNNSESAAFADEQMRWWYYFKATSQWFARNSADLESGIRESFSRYGDYCFVCGCLREGTGCFAPGSRIAMADGSTRAIEEIRAGDWVLNPITAAPAAVERVIEGAEVLPLIEYGYGANLSRVSQKHPVLTSMGMKRAADLAADDAVIGGDGRPHPLTALRTLPVEDGQMVLNLVINQDSADEQAHMLLADGMVTGDFAAQLALSAK